MSSVNKKILFEQLNQIEDSKIQFYLYERNMNKNVNQKYSSWILCCGINSSNILERTWEDIVDCFAVYFQTKLDLEIERSNLYIIFFLESEISNQLKMTIEYDRYSSRKIIVNEKYSQSDDEREKKIEDLIFFINEYQENIEEPMLFNWVEDKEPVLNRLYEKFINGNSTIENAFAEYSDI